MVTEYKAKYVATTTNIVLLGLCIFIFSSGCGQLIRYFFYGEEISWLIVIYFIAFPILEMFLVRENVKNNMTIIDEDHGIIFNRANVKSPVSINDIKDVCVRENKKGWYRGQLVLHTYGTRFMNLQTDKANAYAIVAHLKRLNPSIEVKSNTHIV